MYHYSKEARKISRQQVPDTCPSIDEKLKVLENTVKDQTGNLRDALEEWIERALIAEEKVEKLELKVESLEEELRELK